MDCATLAVELYLTLAAVKYDGSDEDADDEANAAHKIEERLCAVQGASRQMR